MAARARVRREWLQKDPTPRAGDGDFHWWPGTADEAVRAELAGGAEGEVTVWLAPGRVVVARRFAAIAPADGRRYTGIAAVIVEGDASAAALLGAAEVPAPRPWSEDDGEVDGAAREVAVREPVAREAPAGATPALVTAAWRGGGCGEADAGELGALPARLAAIEAWLPAPARGAARRIVVGGERAAAVTAGGGDADRLAARIADRVVERVAARAAPRPGVLAGRARVLAGALAAALVIALALAAALVIALARGTPVAPPWSSPPAFAAPPIAAEPVVPAAVAPPADDAAPDAGVADPAAPADAGIAPLDAAAAPPPARARTRRGR